ncbi:MAG: hypothetical protein KBS44_04935, partial [Clostridiales bacterium]|nr:hypothetical protein [Candidatus Coliplasma equi]
SVKITDPLYAAIEADLDKAAPTKAADAGTVCPFTFVGTPVNGVQAVAHKADFPESMGRGWLKNYIDDNNIQPTAKKTCESGNTVTFSDLDLGYYLIQPGEGAIATVNTTTPTVNVVDKNPRKPENVDKSVTNEGGVNIGDKVPYSVTFTATNFYIPEGNVTGDAVEMIDKYTAVDVALGLMDISSIVVKYYKEGEDLEGEGHVIAKSAATGDNGWTVSTSTASKSVKGVLNSNISVTEYTNTITIPWAAAPEGSDELASLYPSPVTVVIEYEMTVSAEAAEIYGQLASNEVTVTGYNGNSTIPVGSDDEDVPTTSISLRKYDGATSDTIDGAYFILFKEAEEDEEEETSGETSGEASAEASVEETSVEETSVDASETSGEEEPNYVYYKWDNTNKTIIWTPNKDEATPMLADNLYETQEFKGLSAGTYYIEETINPDGYTKLVNPVVVVITLGTDKKFTVTQDGETVTANKYGYYTVQVANYKGSAMPSTGGTGKFVLISCGVVLFLAAAIVLVTKKRMYNED